VPSRSRSNVRRAPRRRAARRTRSASRWATSDAEAAITGNRSRSIAKACEGGARAATIAGRGAVRRWTGLVSFEAAGRVDLRAGAIRRPVGCRPLDGGRRLPAQVNGSTSARPARIVG
jgi:hypothetical protein